MMQRSAVALATLTLLAGCATMPTPAARPVIEMPAAFSFAPPANAEAPLPEQLLPVNDPAFVGLLKKASNAPDIAIALARIDAARAIAQRAGAERLPSVDGSASAGFARSNPEQFGNLPPAVAVDSTRLTVAGNITASWDADLFGRLRASQRAAQLRVDAAGFDAQAVRIAIIHDVAIAVVDWRGVQARKSALQDNINAVEQQSRLVNSRVRAGLNPAVDGLRAEALDEALGAQLPLILAEEAQIVARMVALTATPANAVLADLNQPAGQSASAVPLTSAPSALIAARPDVQAAASRLAASDADLAATAARRFPQFNISSALGLLAFSFGGLFDADAITGQLGAGVAAPLLDFGRIEADIARDEAQTRVAFQQLRQISFAALGEAELSFANIAQSDASAERLLSQIQRESDVARLAGSRYRAGLDNLITALDAQSRAYSTTQQGFAAATQAQRARVALWRSLGGYGVELPSPAQSQP